MRNHVWIVQWWSNPTEMIALAVKKRKCIAEAYAENRKLADGKHPHGVYRVVKYVPEVK